jgi:ubiquinone/menaquinone biosynthesis C-methylase UbiE
VLGHIDDYGKFLKESRRILKTGGLLITTTPEGCAVEKISIRV